MKQLSSALNGKNNFCRYLVLFLASFLGGQLIGGIPLLIVMMSKLSASGEMIKANPENIADLSVFGIDQNTGLILTIIPFITSLFILLFLFKPMHGRNYKSLITGAKKIRWNRFMVSAAFWFAMCGIWLIIDYQLNGDNYKWNLNTTPFIILCFISVLLIPFQASYEEVLFRGYLAQGVAAWTKSRILVIILPSVLFGLMHALNPEVTAYGFWLTMPQYILFGLVFSMATVLDDGIEIAMGAHSANNIFMSIFVTSHSSVLQTPALFVQTNINAVADLVTLSVFSIVFILIMGYFYKWELNILFNKLVVDEKIEIQSGTTVEIN
ncbi:MAG: CPBP family intramembrane glutamic endopeptidase [Bacteroidales bacterium]